MLGRLKDMTRLSESGDMLKCNFCSKTQKQVVKLIAGPGVYICNECIDLFILVKCVFEFVSVAAKH